MIIIIGGICFISDICRFAVYEHAACMLSILTNELDLPNESAQQARQGCAVHASTHTMCKQLTIDRSINHT